MRDTKRRLEAFAFFDHTGIQAHLENMAAQGWMVEQPGTYLWRYRRVEPQTLRFAVTYFPAASEFDPGPTEGQQTYQDYCESAGWHLAARWGQMQIFYTAAQDPVPLETDACTQVDTVHRAMRRSSLPGMTAVAALGLFQLCFQLWRFWEDPVDFLSTPSSLYALPTWLLFLGIELYELLFYFRWHRRAKALAETTGEFLPIRTHRRLSLLLVVIALLFFLSAFLGNARTTLFATLFWLAAFALILLLTNTAKSALKGMRAPRAVTRAVTIGMSAVLAVALVGGMIALIFRGVRSGWLEDRRPVETYAYKGMTWEVYQDDIPPAGGGADGHGLHPLVHRGPDLRDCAGILPGIRPAAPDGRPGRAGPGIRYRGGQGAVFVRHLQEKYAGAVLVQRPGGVPQHLPAH